jgi:iron complex outermembrane receptor protein
VSVEYYFGKVGLLSASVFRKNIENFIGSLTLENVPFSQTGVPFSTIPGATASTIVSEFSMPINVEGTKKLTGVELAAQSQFSFLPAPFDNLGAVANYTYVDADDALTGISKTSYNVTLYYETDNWGLRGSLSHRARWYSGRSDDPMSASTRGFEGLHLCRRRGLLQHHRQAPAVAGRGQSDQPEGHAVLGPEPLPLQPDPERHDLHDGAQLQVLT